MARGRAANYDEQRATILARAAALFAEHGYGAASMNRVAEATGVSKATLYHYFRDKDALLFEIAYAHVSKLDAIVATTLAEDLDPQTCVQTLIDRIMREYAGARAEHTVLSSEVRFLPPTERRRVLDKERRVVAGFADALARWQPGLARDRLAKPTTMLLFGMINWMFTWVRPEGRLTYAELAPLVVDLIVGGVPGIGGAADGVVTPKKAAKNAVSRSRATSTLATKSS
jgi:AcrR family transcriptional regulator